MALPKIFQMLFGNDGKGPKLREDILPEIDVKKLIMGEHVLELKEDGSLMLDANTVITSAGGIVAKGGYILKGDTSGSLYVMSGSGWANAGGYLALAPQGDVEGASFALVATNGTNTTQLKGTPDGTLTLNGKEVERVNSSGTNWVRYENGLQICFVRVTYTKNADSFAVTYPVAFSGNYPAIIPNIWAGNATTVYGINTLNESLTGCTVKVKSISTTPAPPTYDCSVSIVAIGKWK